MNGQSTVIVSTHHRVGTITLNRPETLNALNDTLMHEVVTTAETLDTDPDIGAILITGSEKAFAAGADIKEMASKDFAEMYSRDWFARWDEFARLRTPVVAAVSGYALGGGCELALCADIRIAGESAVLGQPEITLGVIPGAGGTQRLARLVGPSRAKELIFTGRFVPAEEALRIGLVDRVVPDDQVQAEAAQWAAQFADGPRLALRAAKSTIDRGLGTDLATGLALEAHEFAALFATRDRAIGMASFLAEGPGKARFEGQ